MSNCMCAFYLNKTQPRAKLKKLCEENMGEVTMEKPTTGPGRASSSEITRKGPVGCKLTFLHRVPSKSSSSAIPPRWSTNYTTSSATGAAKLHLPRKAKIKLVRTHGPSVLYFYLERNQSDPESEGLPNLVFWFALISHLPATVARAHEHSKNTNKRTGPEEAPCSPHNSPSSTTVFKLYDSGQETKHVYVRYHGI